MTSSINCATLKVRPSSDSRQCNDEGITTKLLEKPSCFGGFFSFPSRPEASRGADDDAAEF